MVEQAKKGAAIDWFVIEPAIARGNAAGVSKRSPHPPAAVLFSDSSGKRFTGNAALKPFP